MTEPIVHLKFDFETRPGWGRGLLRLVCYKGRLPSDGTLGHESWRVDFAEWNLLSDLYRQCGSFERDMYEFLGSISAAPSGPAFLPREKGKRLFLGGGGGGGEPRLIFPNSGW